MQITFNLNPESDPIEKLCSIAEELLKNADKKQYTQAVVLYTNNNIGCGVLIEDALSEDKSDEKSLFDLLKAKNDTKVNSLICIWHDGCVDLPSYSFRKMLLELNPKNEEAKIVFPKENGWFSRSVKSTMK